MTSSAFVLLIFLTGSPAGAVSEIRFVDDLGKPISAGLDVCLSRGSNTKCGFAVPYQVPVGFEAFESLTVDGPFHGPVLRQRSDLESAAGHHMVTVPRKARLRVREPARAQTLVSLYPQTDRDFRKPAYSFSDLGPAGVLIPAGDWVLSVSGRGSAPFLEVLSAKPGGEHLVDARSVPGWSLLTRCLSAPKRTTVNGASLVAAPLVQDDRMPKVEWRSRVGGPSGLVFLSGLQVPYVSLTVAAPGFLPTKVPGVSARPGSFAFREVSLGRGGSAEASVTLEGKAARGLRCELLDPVSHPGNSPDPPLRLVAEAKTDRNGRCATARLPEGRYVFRVKAQKEAGTEQFVDVVNDEVQRIRFDLEKVLVSGLVLRGPEPEPNAVVEAVRLDGNVPPDAGTTLSAATDDEGRYELALWSSGHYWLRVRAGTDAASDSRRMWIASTGANVDFVLNRARLEGVVVNDREEPVPGSIVLVVFNQRSSRIAADPEGRFSFSVSGDGVAKVRALHQSYRPSAEKEVAISASENVPPVILQLGKSDRLRGRLLSPAGIPIHGGAVISYERSGANPLKYLDSQVTDRDGRFESIRSTTGTTTFFVTGGGCSLSVLDVAGNPVEETVLRCVGDFAGFDLTVQSPTGEPHRHEALNIVQGSTIIPRAVLGQHLALMGLPPVTDASGRVVIVGLAPGSYQLYLMRASSEQSIAAGSNSGHLASLTLLPNDIAELRVEFRAE